MADAPPHLDAIMPMPNGIEDLMVSKLVTPSKRIAWKEGDTHGDDCQEDDSDTSTIARYQDSEAKTSSRADDCSSKTRQSPAEDGSAGKAGLAEAREFLDMVADECKANLKYFHGRAVTSLGAFADDCNLEINGFVDSMAKIFKQTEAGHQMEVAKLRAEVAMLKDRLGIKSDPELPQAMLFQSQNKRAVAANAIGAGRGGGGGGSGHRQAPSGTDNSVNGQQFSSPKSHKSALRGKEAVPSGAWQHFVAWVPSGTSLGHPTPWAAPPTPAQGAVVPMSGTSTRGMGVAPSHRDREVLLPQKSFNRDNFGMVEREKSLNRDIDGEHPEFEVLEAWQHMEEGSKKRRKSAKNDQGQQMEYKDMMGGASTEGIAIRGYSRERGIMKYFIMHPHSSKRVCWDLASLLLVIYDMVMIPMSVFELDETPFLVSMEWITRLFWTLDMGMSCLTGVVQANGLINMKFKFILGRYIRTWFAVDVLVVSADWIGFIIAQGGIGMLGRASRVVRVIRVVRLLRLMKLANVMEMITERIQSDSVVVLAQLLKLLVAMLAFAHVSACLWWGVGKMSRSSWISDYDYSGARVLAQYLIALHWSLKQFNGGMEEITPGNPSDRLFAILVWIAAFMFGAMIVSILTSSLTQLYMIEGTQARNMALLRKYLTQNAISRNLASRIQRSAKHALLGELTPDMIELLNVISEPLRVELHHEMYSSAMHVHPFFAIYFDMYLQEARQICRLAMSSFLVDGGDVVFTEGEMPRRPKMYIVTSGKFDYDVSGRETVDVAEKQWVSEAALWTEWQHVGTLTALEDGKLVLLDAVSFQEIANQFTHPQLSPLQYAKDFVSLLNKTAILSDLMEPPVLK